MKYGLTLPNVGPYGDARTLANLARIAEGAGWDGVFVWDVLHYEAEDKAVCDPWVALAAIAMQTERIKIGTMVAVPSRRRPWKMAREAVSLDHLSRGRLILGIGAGDADDKGFTQFGEETDAKKRARLLDESLEILQGLWSGQPFSYSGEHYHFEKITFLPTPIQKPRIPIWIAGTWPRKGPMSRAARWDGVFATIRRDDGNMAAISAESVEPLKQWMDEHRTSTSAPGSAPFDIIVSGPAFAAEHDEQARATLKAYADAGATWCLKFIGLTDDIESLRASIQQGPPRL